MYIEIYGEETFGGDVHHETLVRGFGVVGPEEATDEEFLEAFSKCEWDVRMETGFGIVAKIKNIGKYERTKPGEWKIDTEWDVQLTTPDHVESCFYYWLDDQEHVYIGGVLPDDWQIVTGWGGSAFNELSFT